MATKKVEKVEMTVVMNWIFYDPYNLAISINREGRDGKYGILIQLIDGSDRPKNLIEFVCPFEGSRNAMSMIGDLLDVVRRIGNKASETKREEIVPWCRYKKAGTVNPHMVMNQRLIRRILTVLRNNGGVKTRIFFPCGE